MTTEPPQPTAGNVGSQHEVSERDKEHSKLDIDIAAVSDDALTIRSKGGRSTHVPMRMKIFAVLMVSLIGFGSHWSSGVTGAMKSTLKKVRQYMLPVNIANR